MILAAHILSAVLSLACTTLVIIHPSQRLFRANYILIGSTTLSGAVLVLATHVHILQTCLSGLLYLAVALLGTVFAHKLQQSRQ